MYKNWLKYLCFAAVVTFTACDKQVEKVAENLPETVGAVRTVPAKDHGRSLFEQNTPPSTKQVDVVPNLTNARSDNSLGMWLWYLQGTGYASHSALADKLASLGVKRIYVKVADGSYNPSAWPEVDDASVTAAYKAKGIEPWAWAYNYPGNEAAQAKALYQSAKAGYVGFVTDVEIEFDRTTTSLESLLSAFVTQKNKAVTDGFANSNFKLYCTTWGNPKDHGMRVDIIDKYVDAHMPQTYVEVWGASYMSSATTWVNAGTQEYRNLGCKKPIHHIVSNEYNDITARQMNSFIDASGPETSVWRVPGGGTPLTIWNTLAAVNWNKQLYPINNTASVTLVLPAIANIGSACTFSGTAGTGVTSVQLTADGFNIGTAKVTNGQWSLSYTFNTAGNSRVIVAKGLNSAGTQIASATANLTVGTNTVTNQVTATIPSSIVVGSPVTFTGTATGAITSVQISTDGYNLGTANVVNGKWSFTNTYLSSGNNRRLTVAGRNSSGTVLVTVNYSINVAAAAANYVTGVPYFYQYNNSINPGGSCQNTSIAMVMRYFATKEGKNTIAAQITPDNISSYWGTSRAQTISGFNQVFNQEAAFKGVSARATSTATGTVSQLQAAAKSGKPVIVHGYFTSYGHVMVVLGFDGTSYICHDPAGKWSQIYGSGGYSTVNSTEGNTIRYSKTAFENAVAPDGNVWMHTF